MNKVMAYRGSILHFLCAPQQQHDTESYQYFDDGLLVVENGRVKMVGAVAEVKKKLTVGTEIIDYSGFLLIPGFIDMHIHYAQTEIIASYGEKLLTWLNNYVFPAEKKYSNPEYAATEADFFLRELLRHGTTTAAVYSTVHQVAANALFASAERLNMRIITGKTLMDRNAPDYLLDTPESAYTESKQLIAKWHGRDRLLYAVTPRFAPTSTEAQLEVASTLLQEFPSVYLQTHISESEAEVEWVKELYPWSKDYTDVYDHYGLLGSRSLFGHAIHLSDRESQRLYETKSVLLWCPTSNFFLGSGLFDLSKARKFNNRIGIATDMGAGPCFSMLRTLNEAYKVAALQGLRLSPLECIYRITLGNAEALSLGDKIGNFAVGKEADFLVLNLKSTPLLASKISRCETLAEKLFALSMLGDDRVVQATYILGKLKFQRSGGTKYAGNNA